VAFAWRVQPTEEPEAPDAVLTGAQMYDYTVPSTLKAWLDHVILFGRTAGENPSARETPVTVVASRGGSYAPGTPGEDDEHAQNCLGLILAGTLGLDVDFIVPGLTMAPHNPAMAELVPLFGASRERALQEARGKAKALAERLAAQPAGDRSDVRVPADSHGDGTRTAFAVLPALSRGRRAGAGSFRSSRRRRRSSCPSCRS
jgi:FMN-dependent NADH-azoreductase